jgi:hypothetical protein
MCLRNLFCGEANCTWLLFIIVILLLIDNGDCGCDDGCGYTRNTCC